MQQIKTKRFFLSNHKTSFWNHISDKKTPNYSCQPSQLLGTPMWQQGSMTATIIFITGVTPLALAAVAVGHSFCISAVILQNPVCSRAKGKKCLNTFTMVLFLGPGFISLKRDGFMVPELFRAPRTQSQQQRKMHCIIWRRQNIGFPDVSVFCTWSNFQNPAALQM